MYIRGNKLIKLLEEFQSTKPKKEDRIPYEEWRRLVNFLTNSKDLKLQVKTEPSTLIIIIPASGKRCYFNTGDYFIKFFQERPITTIFSSPKFERFWDNTTFITDDDGNKFMVPNLDFELSDFPNVDFGLNDLHISDVERSEVCTEEKPSFNAPMINDPYSGQPYFQNSDGIWKPLTQYYDTITPDSTSPSNTLNITTLPHDTNNITTINTLGYLQPFITGWEDPPYSAEKATESLKNPTENLSKGSSNKMYLNLNNFFDFGPMIDGSVMQTLLLMSMMNNADGNFFGNIFGNGQA